MLEFAFPRAVSNLRTSLAGQLLEGVSVEELQLPQSSDVPPDFSRLSEYCALQRSMCETTLTAPQQFEHATWQRLGFHEISESRVHSFVFDYEASDVGPGARFTLDAYSDLDCDGVWLRSWISGTIDEQGQLQTASCTWEDGISRSWCHEFVGSRSAEGLR